MSKTTTSSITLSARDDTAGGKLSELVLIAIKEGAKAENHADNRDLIVLTGPKKALEALAPYEVNETETETVSPAEAVEDAALEESRNDVEGDAA